MWTCHVFHIPTQWLVLLKDVGIFSLLTIRVQGWVPATPWTVCLLLNLHLGSLLTTGSFTSPLAQMVQADFKQFLCTDALEFVRHVCLNT